MIFWGRSWPIKSDGFWGLRGTAGTGFFSIVPKQKRGQGRGGYSTLEYGKRTLACLSGGARLCRIPPAHPPALLVAEKGLVLKHLECDQLPQPQPVQGEGRTLL